MTVCGVILAGGNAARMGSEKTLLDLAGRPVLAHVIARFAPQVSVLALNANGDARRFAAFGLPVFGDETDDPATPRQGPLAGVLAALRYARAQDFDLLATVPGDAPFLPERLVERLHAGLTPHLQACLARRRDGIEPLFGLWRSGALDPIAAAFAAGERALHRAAMSLPHGFVVFDSPQDTHAFFNLNTPGDLTGAQALTLVRAENPQT